MKLFDLNIERAILATVFYSNEMFDELSSNVESEHFYHPFHRQIFTTMLQNTNGVVDEALLRSKILPKNFDEELFTEILAITPLINLDSHVEELIGFYTKRSLMSLTTSIQKIVQDETISSEQSIDNIQEELFRLSVGGLDSFRNAAEIVKSTLEAIKLNKQKKKGELIGLDTGFLDLNKITSGFNNGDMIIIAARPAMGKTTLALNLADNILHSKGGVAFFSLEMSAEQLLLRMVSSKTSIPLQNLRTGNLEDSKWSDAVEALDYYSKLDFFVDDGGLLNIAKLRTKLRRLKLKNPNIKVAIIDYIQLMSGNSSKERHLEVSDISRGIKMLARELDMPIIALSQLNRGLETRVDKRPMLADIRESGSIEQDADIIMFVHREDVYKEREQRQKNSQNAQNGQNSEPKVEFIAQDTVEAELIIGKHRNGATGVVKLLFHKKFTRFTDLDTKTTEATVTEFIPPSDDYTEDFTDLPF